MPDQFADVPRWIPSKGDLVQIIESGNRARVAHITNRPDGDVTISLEVLEPVPHLAAGRPADVVLIELAL